VLAARLRADPAPRPPLLGADAAEELAALLERRAPLYAEVAALWIDCGERTVAEIVAELRARLGG
jgi:shikimate kinase